MENKNLVERIISFGLTRQEAVFYLALYKNGALTGYEVSKLTGISRSNVYNGLANLVTQGAAYIAEEGSVTKYIALDFAEFSENKIRTLEQEKTYIIQNLPEKEPDSLEFIMIEGQEHILNKLYHMLIQSKYRVYIYVNSNILLLLQEQLKDCIARGIKVVIITDYLVNVENSKLYIHQIVDSQIQLIVDSNLVLMGEINAGCLYSRQKNFVNVFKQSFANTIKLIELENKIVSG